MPAPGTTPTRRTATVDEDRNRRENNWAHSPPRYPNCFPERITLGLTVDDDPALLGARYADCVPMADRLRALISLWWEDLAPTEAVVLASRGRPLPAPAAPPICRLC